MSFYTTNSRDIILIPSVRRRYPSTLLNGLVSWWEFKEMFGPRFESLGATMNAAENNGQINSASGVGGSIAANFVASDSRYLRIANNAALSVGNRSFTLSSWIYITSLQSTNPTWWARFVGNSSNAEYLFDYDTSYNPRLVLYGSSVGVVTATNTTLAAGSWYHILGWRDVPSNLAGISVNRIETTATYSSTITSRSIPTDFGFLDGVGRYFDGRMQRIGFWNRILTQSEKDELYLNGASNNYPFN